MGSLCIGDVSVEKQLRATGVDEIYDFSQTNSRVVIRIDDKSCENQRLPGIVVLTVR